MSAPTQTKKDFERAGEVLAKGLAAEQREKSQWYDLDRWARYSDPIIAAGFGLFVAGVIILSHSIAAGFVIGGAGVMGLGWLMAKSS